MGSLGFADQVRLVSVVAAPLGEPVESGPEAVAGERGLLYDQVLGLASICKGHAVSVSRSGFEDRPHPLAEPGGHDASQGGCMLSGMGSGTPTGPITRAVVAVPAIVQSRAPAQQRLCLAVSGHRSPHASAGPTGTVAPPLNGPLDPNTAQLGSR
jgi:hypothetical protein